MNTQSGLLDQNVIQQNFGKSIIIKASGELFLPKNQHHVEQLFNQIFLLKAMYMHPILIHGCNPHLKAAFAEKGHVRETDADENYKTTDATIGIVADVMTALNADICKQFNKWADGSNWALQAVGMDAFSQNSPVMAVSHNERTGKITAIKTDEIAALLPTKLPILSSLGMDENGQPYNINADDVACETALALDASALIFMSYTNGILDQQQKTIPSLDEKTIDAMIAAKTLDAGMKKKVTQMLNAAAHGIQKVTTLNFYEPSGLLNTLFGYQGATTATKISHVPSPLGGIA